MRAKEVLPSTVKRVPLLVKEVPLVPAPSAQLLLPSPSSRVGALHASLVLCQLGIPVLGECHAAYNLRLKLAYYVLRLAGLRRH